MQLSMLCCATYRGPEHQLQGLPSTPLPHICSWKAAPWHLSCLLISCITSPLQMTSPAGAFSSYSPTSVRNPSRKHSKSTREASILCADWWPSKTIEELSSLGIGLQLGVRSMASKRSTPPILQMSHCLLNIFSAGSSLKAVHAW